MVHSTAHYRQLQTKSVLQPLSMLQRTQAAKQAEFQANCKHRQAEPSRFAISPTPRFPGRITVNSGLNNELAAAWCTTDQTRS